MRFSSPPRQAWSGIDRGVFANSTAPRLRQELEDSLRRLGTDYIDLYQVHWPDTLVPIAEVACLFAEFQRDGKVRALGVSNFSAAQMEEFRRVAPLASDQPPYNLFERQIDDSVLPWCAANGIAVLSYSSLCRSLLGGRTQRGMRFNAGDIRSADPKFQEPRFSQYMTAVERLAAFSARSLARALWNWRHAGCWTGRVFRWLLWGAKRPDQLDAMDGVMGWKLDAGAMAEIDRIVAESVSDPVGPEYLTPLVRAN